jgi:hypothetical protein
MSDFPCRGIYPLTVFALIVIASLIDQLIAWGRKQEESSARRWGVRTIQWFGMSLAATLVGGNLTTLVMATHQLRWQQRLIEDGERREIGLWLRTQATDSRQTVFLEPLGYIGFNSNLKMLDYPGLSSPEMVAARKRASTHSYPDCWPELIMDLTPNWLVLRNYEADAIRKKSPELFSRYYTLARTFDVRKDVQAISWIAGRGYLMNDAYFEVYRRKSDTQHGDSPVGIRPVIVKSFSVNESWGQPAYQSGSNLVAHAPSRLVFKKPVGAHWLTGGFGLFEGAYADPHKSTDGAVFTISLISPRGTKHEILRRPLDPRNQIADRGLQSFSVELPTAAVGFVELSVLPGPKNDNAFDWSYWSGLQLECPHQP